MWVCVGPRDHARDPPTKPSRGWVRVAVRKLRLVLAESRATRRTVTAKPRPYCRGVQITATAFSGKRATGNAKERASCDHRRCLLFSRAAPPADRRHTTAVTLFVKSHWGRSPWARPSQRRAQRPDRARHLRPTRSVRHQYPSLQKAMACHRSQRPLWQECRQQHQKRNHHFLRSARRVVGRDQCARERGRGWIVQWPPQLPALRHQLHRWRVLRSHLRAPALPRQSRAAAGQRLSRTAPRSL